MSYFSSNEGTPSFDRFWEEGHRLTKLGLAAFAGLNASDTDGKAHFSDSDQQELIRYFDSTIYVKLIDNFQTYVVELISSIFSQNPRMVPTGKIDSRSVFEFESIEELRVFVVESAATQYSYMNIVDLDEELKSRFKFPLFANKFQKIRMKRLVEIRNILVHNRGVINNTFLRRPGASFDRIGANVHVPKALSIDHYLMRVGEEIDRAAVAKFGLKRVLDG